jgi:serine/threonine-protein kinase HipA
MKNCLCCQKPVESGGGYHPRCLKRLFDTTRLPPVPFGLADMPKLVIEAEGRMSISGVQPKLSVRFDPASGSMASIAVGGTHILKPESDRFEDIPQNENLCMNMAETLGLRVPPHGLFEMADGRRCYIVKRFDRSASGAKTHKETMSQVLGSKDKYAGSLEQVGKAIRAHATNIGLDALDFFERVLLCFLTGNGDMHMKNWAFLGQGKDQALAPCYDFVCSRMYIPKENDSALTVNGKQSGLKRGDFEALGAYLGLDPKAVAGVFEKLRAAQKPLRQMVVGSELRSGLREEFAAILSSRYKRLYPK